MSNSAGDTALQALNEQAEAISNQVTTDMVDTLLIRDLAAANGVTFDPAMFATEWAKETTLPELRLFRRISIDAAAATQVNDDSEHVAQLLLRVRQCGGA